MIFNIHNETPEEIENRILEERLERFIESCSEDLQQENHPEESIEDQCVDAYEREYEPMTEEEFRHAYEISENIVTKLP